jgi:hypothetical protein
MDIELHSPCVHLICYSLRPVTLGDFPASSPFNNLNEEHGLLICMLIYLDVQCQRSVSPMN